MRRFGSPATLWGCFICLLALPVLAWAAGEGQKDLDAATDLQLTAETLGDLEKVAELCESAIKKGLDKGDEDLAKQMLASSLFQHAQKSSEAIFNQQRPNPRWPLVRERALKNLTRATEVDPSLPDPYLLTAKLQALPNGSKEKSIEAVSKAIDLLKKKDEPKQLAQAFLLRAVLQENPSKQMEDLDHAVSADPKGTEALQARALIHMQSEDFEKASEDLKLLVERDPTNFNAVGALAESLLNAKKYDEAKKYADKMVADESKKALGYALRGRILFMKEDNEGALKDLNEALKLEPNDVGSLLLRSRVLSGLDKTDEAKADVDKALKLRPDLPQAILIRSLLAAEKKKYAEAIADLQLLLRSDPTNSQFRMQLAMFYVADNRPRRAIEMLTNLLEDDDQNADALRARGDAYLSVAKHAEAIKDYEAALKIDAEDTGVLNNYAWVLATSNDDKIRNPKKSLELAKKACDLTDYKKPHILSTLASAHAESGDFEEAKRWSEKAVEMAEPEIKEQLQKELDSYKQKKPWRETQNVEENTKPLDKPDSELET